MSSKNGITKAEPAPPTLAFDSLPLHWMMTRWEKFVFSGFLQALKPDAAIEIGTALGGSLQILAKFAKHVHSIDPDPNCKSSLAGQFPEVTFHIGPSKTEFAKAVAEIKQQKQKLEFILIDGDHSAKGVTSDIEEILKMVPENDIYLIFHDSYFPPVRQAITNFDWGKSPYVHLVEVDYVPGYFHTYQTTYVEPRTMYGGFCLAQLRKEKRSGSLEVSQSQKTVFDAAYRETVWHEKTIPYLIRRSRNLVHKISLLFNGKAHR